LGETSSVIYPTKPGHFSRTLSKGPTSTTWVWNLHADAHDFDAHTSDLEDVSRKVFSAHFGQLGIIFIWLSGCDMMPFVFKPYSYIHFFL
jgi:photosystem I P700 chlorophyll a apoprotein A1